MIFVVFETCLIPPEPQHALRRQVGGMLTHTPPKGGVWLPTGTAPRLTGTASRTLLEQGKTPASGTMATPALQLFHVHFQKGKVTSLGGCITAGTGSSICM